MSLCWKKSCTPW